MIFGMRLTFCHVVSSRFILDHSLHCDNSSRQVQKPTRNQQIPLVDEREALLWSGGFCVWFCVCDALARKMRKKPCCESLKRERTVLCYVVVLVVTSYYFGFLTVTICTTCLLYPALSSVCRHERWEMIKCGPNARQNYNVSKCKLFACQWGGLSSPCTYAWFALICLLQAKHSVVQSSENVCSPA